MLLMDPNDTEERTILRSINDEGAIAGFYEVTVATHGFYGRSGNLHSLDLPGALATQARGINNNGQIVGEYDDGNGLRHAFVTTPIANAACHPPWRPW